MTRYCLELRSTADWGDVRYRDYTTSKSKAERFRSVAKVQFTDSGHGLVPYVSSDGAPRGPKVGILADYVREQMRALELITVNGKGVVRVSA